MQQKNTQTVLVIYEDQETRDIAMAFCDDLMRRFWSECDFALEWCSFDVLRDARSGRAALQKASEADHTVFATHPHGPFPIAVELWVGAWCAQRSHREGTVVGLLDPAREGGAIASRYTWLRKMAHKAGLDYLTAGPLQLRIKLGSESCYQRASAKTTVLEQILSRPHAPVAH